MQDYDVKDYIAICETKARYCRCLDTKDWAGFADIFTEDLELDTTGSGGYKIAGRDEAIRTVSASLSNAKTAHQVHSPEIKFADKDTADVIWAMQDRVVWSAPVSGLQSLTGYGHYHERYVRCPDGRWRISTQVLTRLHMDLQPAAGS